MDKEVRRLIRVLKLDESQAEIFAKGATAAKRAGIANIKEYLDNYSHRMTDKERKSNSNTLWRNYKAALDAMNKLSQTNTFHIDDYSGGMSNGKCAENEIAEIYGSYHSSRGTFETLSSIFSANCYLVSYLSTYAQKIIIESEYDLEAAYERLRNDPYAASAQTITGYILEMNRYLFGIEIIEAFLKIDGFTDTIAPPFRYKEAIQRATEYNEMLGEAKGSLKRIGTPEPPKITDREVRKAAQVCTSGDIATSFSFMTFLAEAEESTHKVFACIVE